MTIRINQLSCSYSGSPVITNLTFAVEPSAFFIIIGPNGSGKTTLIRTLAGLQPISKGEIFFQGHDLKHYKRKEIARRIAYVPQTIAADTPFSVREAVLMGRAPYLGMLGVESQNDLAIADQAIAFVGLSHLADRKIGNLSGGERQRTQIARAICQQPELILLDEPTAALDLAHQVRTMELLAKLKCDYGTTIIMVSHDINLAAMYADRMLLIADGHAAVCGPPEMVVDEKILYRTYNCRIQVDTSPAGPWPRVTLIPEKRDLARNK